VGKTGHRGFARHYGLSSRRSGRVTAQNDKVRCPRDAVVELLLGATSVLHARAKQASSSNVNMPRPAIRRRCLANQLGSLRRCARGRFNRIMGMPMSYGNSRKVFLVVAGGNLSAERHFEKTIQRNRTLEEVRRFLPSQEIENLERIYHGSNFIMWGAVPGPVNESRWEKMSPGRRGAYLQLRSHSFCRGRLPPRLEMK
jgi:hypothetical protein